MQAYSVAAVDYAVDVLLAVAEMPDQGVSEIARRLGGSKQRIFRMLRTLEARGLLVRDAASKGYRLGFLALTLGTSAQEQNDLARLAGPLIRALTEATQETVQLHIRDGGDTVCIAKSEPQRDVRVNVIGPQEPTISLQQDVPRLMPGGSREDHRGWRFTRHHYGSDRLGRASPPSAMAIASAGARSGRSGFDHGSGVRRRGCFRHHQRRRAGACPTKERGDSSAGQGRGAAAF